MTALRQPLLTVGSLAGFAGGIAEIAWIALFGRIAGGDAAAVARGVTETFSPGLAATSLGIPLGIIIHQTIAVALGIVIAVLLRQLVPALTRTLHEPIAVVGLLAAIWAMNFLVVLPVVNPAFIDLIPYGVSLISKVLFGASAALVLYTAIED